MHEIIAGDTVLHVSARVRTWRETNLYFPGLRRRLITRYVMHRWSGSAGLSPRVFRALTARAYGPHGVPLLRAAHLAVDPDGSVYQFCDLDRLCEWDGTSDDPEVDRLLSNASVGIVAVNPGGPRERERGVTRVLLQETIHGVDAINATLTGAQLATLLELTRTVCAHYGLPPEVPMEGGDVVARMLRPSELFDHAGVLGHYMVQQDARSPGLALMRAFAAMPLRGKDGAAE